MPYKFNTKKLIIPTKYDRRVKLTTEEKELIKEAYGKVSQRKLAKIFEVSRRLIQFIGDPNKQKQNLLRRKERGGSKVYYDRKKNTETMKKHRRYKQELMIKGLLEVNKENGNWKR